MTKPAQISVVAAALLLGACVGPDFHRPPPPAVDGYIAGPVGGETSAGPGAQGAAQKFLPAADVPANWWLLFDSPQLEVTAIFTIFLMMIVLMHCTLYASYRQIFGPPQGAPDPVKPEPLL